MNLPTTDFLKGICTEDSDLTKLNCVGPFYADQIKSICGHNSLGHFLKYCSYRDGPELTRVLQQCSRNKRAGEPNEKGQVIPQTNVRVLASLLQLIALGRKNPLLFPHFNVHINVCSADLNAMLQSLL